MRGFGGATAQNAAENGLNGPLSARRRSGPRRLQRGEGEGRPPARCWGKAVVRKLPAPSCRGPLPGALRQLVVWARATTSSGRMEDGSFAKVGP